MDAGPKGNGIMSFFTDELRFNLEYSDGKQRVWRRPGERYDEQNIVVSRTMLDHTLPDSP